MLDRVARHAEDEMRLVGLLREHADTLAPMLAGRLGRAGLAARQVAEELRCAREGVVADLAGDADDHPRRRVPAVEVLHERLARRLADGLLAADDVPAERLVAVEQALVDAAYVVARCVEVHVHLLDDHALLALDLLGVEA
jgi:hypothetical protein